MTQQLLGRVAGRPHVQKAAANTGWLLADKVTRQIVNVVVTVSVARYLGPSQFGSLNYALALVLLFSAVGTLGLDRIAVRDTVRAQGSAGEILGTVLGLRLMAGLATAVLPVGLVLFLRPSDTQTLSLVAIVAAGNLFQGFDAIDLRFQARLQSRYSVWAKAVAFLLAAIAKIVLVLAKAPVMAFAWVAFVEVLLGALNLVAALRLTGERLRDLKYSSVRAKVMTRESWPLILSSISIAAYMRIDQTMLGQIKGFTDVGIYAAAVRLSEVWSFIPTAIATSVFPALVESSRTNPERYHRRLQKLFYLMSGLAYAIALPMTVGSSRLMVGLYGSQFAAAGPVLAIHIWGAPFLFVGVIRGYWAVNEGLTWFVFGATALGTVVNVILNLMLIPTLGALGAATSLFVSQIVASYAANCWSPKTRAIFRMQSRALFPVHLLARGS